MPNCRSLLAVAFTLTGLLATASSAVAQSGTPLTTSDTGPLVLAPVQSSIVLAPDFKVTTIDGQTAVLAGGYVGRVTEQIVFAGLGAYWLADPRDDARMFYGGLMLGVRLIGTDRLNVSARGLLGVGQGTLYDTVSFADARHPSHVGHQDGLFRVAYRQNFLVAEPEIRFSYEVVDGVSLNLGAGYRATSADGRMDDRLRGATGTIGVQFDLH